MELKSGDVRFWKGSLSGEGKVVRKEDPARFTLSQGQFYYADAPIKKLFYFGGVKMTKG